MIDKSSKKYSDKIVKAFLKIKSFLLYPQNIQKYLQPKNLESYVKVKLKSQLQVLKPQAQVYPY